MKLFKTITIAQVLTDINTFSVPINIPFVPTHFIVKYVSITNIVTANAINDFVLLLKTNLVNDPIFHFIRSGIINQLDIKNHSLDLKFNLNSGFITGNHDFYFTDINGNVPDNIANNIIQIALAIEFVREI